MVFLIGNKGITQRRGVSQVLGSLFMLAIVAGLGSVLLFQGINGLNNFNASLALFQEDKQSSREDLIIEHVRFHNDAPPETPTDFLNVNITIRNIGTVEVTINTITMVNVTGQDLPINNSTLTDIILVGDIKSINLETNLQPSATVFWNTRYEYRITVTTAEGNSFVTLARPFNT